MAGARRTERPVGVPEARSLKSEATAADRGYCGLLPFADLPFVLRFEQVLLKWGSAPHPGTVACGGPYAPRRSLAGAQVRAVA